MCYMSAINIDRQRIVSELERFENRNVRCNIPKLVSRRLTRGLLHRGFEYPDYRRTRDEIEKICAEEIRRFGS